MNILLSSVAAAFAWCGVFMGVVLVLAPASDRLGREIAELIIRPTAARERLSGAIYKTLEPSNALGLLQQALGMADTAEALDKRIRLDGVKTGRVTARDLPGRVEQALRLGIIDAAEAA